MYNLVMNLKAQTAGDKLGSTTPERYHDNMSPNESSVPWNGQSTALAEEIRRQVDIFLQIEPLHVDAFRELAKK